MKPAGKKGINRHLARNCLNGGRSVAPISVLGMLQLNNDFVESVFRDHEGALFGYLFALLKNRQDAEEVKQEVFLHLLQRPSSESIRNPKAFTYRIARNLALNRIRYRNVRRIEDNGPTDDEPISPTVLPERAIESRQELGRLIAVVEGLAPRCREVFILHKFHEMSYAEISKKLGISKSMVKKHLRRALSQCLTKLDFEW